MRPIVIIVSHNNASEGAPLQAAKLAEALADEARSPQGRVHGAVLLSLCSGSNPDPRFTLLGKNPLTRLIGIVEEHIDLHQRDVVVMLNTVVSCQIAANLRETFARRYGEAPMLRDPMDPTSQTPKAPRVHVMGVVHELKTESFKWVTAEHLSALKSVVFVSECSSDTFPAEMTPAVPRRVIHNWLTERERASVDRYRTAHRPATTQRTTVLMCGVLAQHKRQLPAARAFGLLARGRPDLHLVLLGTVYDQNYADLIVRAAGGPARVTVAGPVPHEEVLRHMAGCAALVHCAAMESCSLVVLEAMYSGAAIVAARAGGIPEQVRHNVSGLLYDHGGVDEHETIAALLSTVLDDAGLRRELGAAARAAVDERFEERAAVSQYLDAIEAL